VSADAAPLEAPEGIQPEIERPPSELFETPPSVVPGALGAPDVSANLVAPPPPAAREVEPLRVGGRIQPPERTYGVAPVYPPIALAARREGTVILEATIDADGSVRGVRVLRSVPLLDDAAMDAVRQWRFTPTRLNGDPVPVVMTVTVTFSLK
jgi:protein TonB